MASYNRVVLVGNVTRDPELRHIPSGTAVTELGLAVNERIKRNNEWVEEVNFIDVTLWARTAEVAAEYLSKGSSVLIEGRLKLDRWEKEGQKFSKLKVIGEKMQMLGGRGGGGSSQGGSSYGNSSYDNSSQGNSNQGNSNQGGPSQSDSFAPADDFAPAGGPPPSDEIPF